MSSQQGDQKPQIHSDEDWKDRIKAEDAALDAQFRAETESLEERESTPDAAAPQEPERKRASSEPSDADLPAPSFFSLISMFSTQAMVSLGVIPNPASGEAEPNLPLARHFIDTIGVLEDKTKGNLEPNEQNFLTQTLHQLRMAFVEISKHQTSEKK